ncbi:sensor histidine kinase [Cohnella nanjingensis]|uniref:Histidine kinase n=1 Tax=Cohnella nanjingensis TaxID=1387779 RepID=A0A7X0RPR8_9BACL|nr:histidine kinase [Cohnella nanjingensis]MBB6671403.1 histidine kinase [Cohnella nanjingensis]
MRFATLRARLILGFSIVTIPLVILLLSNNLYATKVVHSQVAQSNQNLLTMYMNDMDKVLEEIENYLYKASEQDQSLQSLGLYAPGTWEAYLAQTQTASDLFLNTNYYDAADVLFAYSSSYDNLLTAPQQSVSYERKQRIQEKLRTLLRGAGARYDARWNVVELDGSHALLRIVDTGEQSCIGAWVDLDKLMMPLRLLTRDGRGEALLLGKDGQPISQSSPSQSSDSLQAIRQAEGTDPRGAAYNIVKLDKRYLLMEKPSRTADLKLLLLLPERTLLEGLPYFRILTYWVPLIAAAMLILYLVFLQRSIVRPIHQLVKGMRRIRSGDLRARLEDNKLVEFIAINETFNGMVQQIEHLKIDIYEEQIRTQKAELKALQAQIHPHFFMNSLNIVYHLAQVRSYEIIQSLALHLVRYFRYATRTQVAAITVKEEMSHIHDYLSIQKYRFPEALTFEFQVDPALETFELPPLAVQPLVENAMVHGFSFKIGEPYRIRVRVYAEQDQPDGTVCIEVSDNGRGFAELQPAELEETAHALEPGDGHVGLWNVVRRCRLFYKNQVKMRFANGTPRGAIVTLHLPRSKQEAKGESR